MRISKKSWHYRLVDKVFFWPSNYLCTYFWQVIWSAIFLGVLIPVCAILMFVVLPCSLGGVILEPNSVLSLGLVFKLWCVGVLYLVAFAIIASLIWYVIQHPRKNKRDKGNNFVLVWLQEKRDKVCSFIKFED